MEIELIKFLQSGKNQFFDVFFGFFTCFAGVVGLVVVFFLLFFKNKKYSLYFLLNYLFLIGFNYILKILTNRPRPYEVDEQILNISQALGKSFPSGHMASATIFCVYIVFYVLKNVKNKGTKILTILCCFLYCFCVGLSRLYFGQHYASDVLGGFFVGILFGGLSLIFLHKKLYKKIWK